MSNIFTELFNLAYILIENCIMSLLILSCTVNHFRILRILHKILIVEHEYLPNNHAHVFNVFVQKTSPKKLGNLSHLEIMLITTN